MNSSVAVLLVEDEALMRLLIADQLKASGYEVVAVASAAEASKVALQKEFAVAVLDVQLGHGPTGFELASVLRLRDPGIALVFLTHLPSPHVMGFDTKVVPKNAAYLVKERVTDVGVLASAISAALRDKVNVALRDDKALSTQLKKTSRSQLQVLRLVAEGKSNQEIALIRGTSIRAVENLLKRAFEAVGLDKNSGQNPRVTAARKFLIVTGQLRD